MAEETIDTGLMPAVSATNYAPGDFDQSALTVGIQQQSPLIEAYVQQLLQSGQQLVNAPRPQYGTYTDAAGNVIDPYAEGTTQEMLNQATFTPGQRVADFTDPTIAAFQYAADLAGGVPQYDAQGNIVGYSGTPQYDEDGNIVGYTSAWQPSMQESMNQAALARSDWDAAQQQAQGLYGEGAQIMRGQPVYDEQGNLTGYSGGVTPEALDTARSGLSAFTSTLPGTLSAYGESVGQWSDVAGDIGIRARGLGDLVDPYTARAEQDIDQARAQAAGMQGEVGQYTGEAAEAYRGLGDTFSQYGDLAGARAQGLGTLFDPYASQMESRAGQLTNVFDEQGNIVEQKAGSLGTQFDPYATQMMDRATGLRGQFDPKAEEAAGLYRGTTGQFQRSQFDPTSGAIESYIDPYTQAVKQAAFRDIDEAQAKGLNELRADAAARGAFGGSRHGIAEGELLGEAIEQKSQIGSQLDSANYQQALAAAMGEHGAQQTSAQQAYEAQRGGQQAAGAGLAGLGAQQAGLTSQEAGLIGNVGQTATGLTAQEAALLQGLGTTRAGLTGQEAGLYGDIGQTRAGLSAQEAGLLSGLGSQEAAIASQGAAGLLGTGQAGLGARQAGLAGFANLAGLNQGLGMDAAGISAQEAALLSGLGQTGSSVYGQYGSNLQNLGSTEAALRNQLATGLYNIGSGTAGLYGQFGQGMGSLGETGANLGRGLASTWGGLGGLQQQYGINDVNMLLGTGTMQQQMGQQHLDMAHGNWLGQQMQPYENLGWMSGMVQGLPATTASMRSSYNPSSNVNANTLGAITAGAGAIAGGGTTTPSWS